MNKDILLITIIFLLNNFVQCRRRPNIVIILIDDVGRNDFSLHGSNQIPTPNIDALGYNGVIFNRHYSLHVCTPSRSVLLTGNHAIRAGLQGTPLAAGEPRALPIWMPTLPEKLRDLGYSTYMVGKWHLGHENRSVTPTGRGFDSFIGYWNGFVGYFDYTIRDKTYLGFDLHRNFYPSFEDVGTYATDLFTEESVEIINYHNKQNPLFLYVSHLGAHTGLNGTELGTPDLLAAMTKYSYIKDEQRRLYADIVNRLDDSVGKIVNALHYRKMLDNTIIVFLSDNGAQSIGTYANSGSNWPLRGLKNTLYEGGIRNSGIIWSKYLANKQAVDNTLFHITDWMPTLYSAAGGDIADLGKIDGINHWPYLTRGSKTKKRSDVLLNIDEVLNFEGILTSDGRFKLTKGRFLNGTYDGYFGDSGRESKVPEYDYSAVLKSKVNRAIRKADFFSYPLTRKSIRVLRNQLEIIQANAERTNLTCDTCLFDLEKDPTETTDVSEKYPDIVKRLEASLNNYRRQMMPQTNTDVDPKSDPANCHGVWYTWLDPVYQCDWLGLALTK